MLPSEQFARAKNGLSEVMNGVVRARRPMLIDRNHGKELALLIGADEARGLLAGFTFDVQVTEAPDECVIRLPELGLIGGGADIDEALTDLLEIVDEYVPTYLARYDAHRHGTASGQFPYVLRLALAGDDERRRMLTGDSAS